MLPYALRNVLTFIYFSVSFQREKSLVCTFTVEIKEDGPNVEKEDLLPRQWVDKHCRDQMREDGLENISNASQIYLKDKRERRGEAHSDLQAFIKKSVLIKVDLGTPDICFLVWTDIHCPA